MSYKPLVGVNAAGGVAVNDADETAIDACSARVDFNPTATPWAATGILPSAKGSPDDTHSVTRLADGRVLAAGGCPAGVNATTACAIFDPNTGAWTATGVLGAARLGHQAILLADGRVLVSGGADKYMSFGGVAKTTCEIYDPSLGTWSGTGAMGTARTSHRSVLLADGRVLVAGGNVGGGPATTSCEIYNPTTGLWAATGAMTAARALFPLVTLPSNAILAAGGIDTATRLRACELFNPASGLWTAAASMVNRRYRSRGFVLASGQVLVATGSNGAFAPDDTCELYDPVANTWALTGTLALARTAADGALLPSGKVIVFGGTGGAGVTATSEIYDPATGTWASSGNMSVSRGDPVSTLLPNGHVLVVGGLDNGGFQLDSCDLLAADVPALTTTSGVASVTTLGTGFYRLTLTAAALASWQAGGRHLYAEPASYAQPRDRSAQIQKAQIVRTNLIAGTIDVFVATEPVGINAAALPFNFWLR